MAQERLKTFYRAAQPPQAAVLVNAVHLVCALQDWVGRFIVLPNCIWGTGDSNRGRFHHLIKGCYNDNAAIRGRGHLRTTKCGSPAGDARPKEITALVGRRISPLYRSNRYSNGCAWGGDQSLKLHREHHRMNISRPKPCGSRSRSNIYAPCSGLLISRCTAHHQPFSKASVLCHLVNTGPCPRRMSLCR